MMLMMLQKGPEIPPSFEVRKRRRNGIIRCTVAIRSRLMEVVLVLSDEK